MSQKWPLTSGQNVYSKNYDSEIINLEGVLGWTDVLLSEHLVILIKIFIDQHLLFQLFQLDISKWFNTDLDQDQY